jgi:hypothetical protein
MGDAAGPGEFIVVVRAPLLGFEGPLFVHMGDCVLGYSIGNTF